ncbi:MAG: heavy-metal-associated domain-containing protein [Candidatus Pacebacteria bacterium]|nr:heavy-metal-associated domain-containing protein [Candidatus Paceibacterota bacterium]
MFDFLKKKKSEGNELTLKIKGMHCVSCSLNIDGGLEELDGVVGANTNYAKAETRVFFDPNKVDEKKIRQTIQELGYEVV